jgi:hypothetical protein
MNRVTQKLYHRFRRGIVPLLVVSLTFGAFLAAHVSSVSAAAPDDLKVLLSDSRKSTTSKYTITLDQAAGTILADNETVTVTFPASFTVPTFVAADATFSDNGASKTLQDAVCGATNTLRITVSGQVVTFTACTGYTESAGGGDVIIVLGTGATKVTNHATAASYQMTIAGSYGDDTKDAAIVITDGVTVSATVDETLTLTVAGETAGNCPNPSGAGAESEIDTSGSAITVPFGTVTPEAFYGACQKLTTSTNAAQGYATTVQTTALMTSGGSTIAKGVCDASCSDTAEAAWATNTNNGMGYCMSDSSGDGAATADAGWASGTNGCNSAGTTNFKTIANAGAAETAQNIMSSPTTASTDVSYIKYRLSVDGAQAAGAYTTTVVYITTGTF